MYYWPMKTTAQIFLALLTAAVAVSLVAFIAPALATDNPDPCYNVTSPDGRAYCLARAKRDPRLCYNVQNADLRSMCLAEVK